MRKILFTVACLALAFYGFAQDAPQYKTINRIKLDGDEGWDYIKVDDSTNMLYVSHGDKVQVVDLSHGDKVVGTITGLHHVHGIALADDLNKGFISSGKDTMVLVFNLTTLAEITRIKVTGPDPDCIVYDQFTHRVFTFNGNGASSTVIDAKTNTVIGTIKLPGSPEFCVSDGKGMLYDNLEDKSMICAINSVTMKVVHTWPLMAGKGPSGLAIDLKNRRLFSVCRNKMMVVMNADNGKIITTLPIGEHPDAAGFDALLGRVYSSNGDGTFTIVQEDGPDKFHLVEDLTTQVGARTCTVNTQTHHIYLSDAQLLFYPKMPGVKKQKKSVVPGTFEVLEVAPGK